MVTRFIFRDAWNGAMDQPILSGKASLGPRDASQAVPCTHMMGGF